jgi:hypothetical protein
MIGKHWKTTTYEKGFRSSLFGGRTYFLLGKHDPHDYRDGERDAREQDRRGRPRPAEQLEAVQPGRKVNGYKPSKGRARHQPVTS